MPSLRFNLLLLGLFAILIFLQYRLWFEPGGVRDMQGLKRQLQQFSQENEQLKKRNEMLLFQIERLHNSEDATESRARNELGMIKKGETFYQVVK
jgi:cell division protein FtsB